MEVKNRFVHSATYECMADETGEVTDDLLKRYRSLAKGEIGLIIPGHMYVHPLGRGMKNQIGIHRDDMIPGLKQLAEAVHQEGVFFPHITEEIYYNFFKQFENDKSIHLSSWPKPIIIDEKKEIEGEFIKNYISQIRAYKSGQSIPLNTKLEALTTYASKDKISILKANDTLIKSTLKFPEEHKFIVGTPNMEEKIIEIKPNYSLIGPKLKNQSQEIIKLIKENQKELIKKIEDKGDIPLSSFFPAGSSFDSNEKLIEGEYIHIKKDITIKDKKDSRLLSFDGFYLELKV